MNIHFFPTFQTICKKVWVETLSFDHFSQKATTKKFLKTVQKEGKIVNILFFWKLCFSKKHLPVIFETEVTIASTLCPPISGCNLYPGPNCLNYTRTLWPLKLNQVQTCFDYDYSDKGVNDIGVLIVGRVGWFWQAKETNHLCWVLQH